MAAGGGGSENTMDFGMPTLIELMDTEKSAALCRELGLRFIELNMSFPQYQPEQMDIEKLRAIKQKYGIYYTIHIDESLDPCSVNPGIAEVYTKTMLKTIEIAKVLGIPTLNMHLLRGIYVTLPERRTYVYAENMDFYLDKLRAFREAVTAAIGESGIKVCVENTDGYDLPFLRAALNTLLESPAFMLTLDVGHDHAIGGIDLPVILERQDRLHHMHLHDARGTNVHLALGDGEIDKARFLRLAEDCGCRVVLETKTIEALRSSARWVMHWLNKSSKPDELWDIYDAQRNKTGKIIRRGDEPGDGEYHLVVHVWIRNARGDYLLTKRDPRKSYGGMWESPGGSATAGEDSLTAALREVQEETGLTLQKEQGRVVKSFQREHFICDAWLFRQEFDLNDIRLQEGETTGARTATAQELRALYENRAFVPCGYLEEILAAE